jgi:hypothetical protein
MRTLLTLGLALGLVAASGLSASAGAPPGGGLFVESAEAASSKLTVSGELRTRWEAVRRNLNTFRTSAHDHDDWVDARMRLGLRFELAAGTEVFVQAQGRYLWGGEAGLNNPEGISNTGAALPLNPDIEDRDSLDVYQAYVVFQPSIFGYETEVKVGRQEIALGSELLLGNDDKYSGVSHDAVKMSATLFDNLSTHLFVAKVVENSAVIAENGNEVQEATTLGIAGIEGNNDTHCFGLWNTYDFNEDMLLDGYVLYVANNDEAGANSIFDTIDLDAKIWTVGLRFKADRLEYFGQKFDFSVEAAMQLGELNAGGDDMDIEDSFAFEIEAGWSPPIMWTPRLAVGYAWASGDEDVADDEYNHFSSMYQEVQGRLGKADLFVLENLGCFYVDVSCKPFNERLNDKLQVGVSYLNFTASEEEDTNVGRQTLGTGDEDDVGDEVDFYASYVLNENAQLKCCWSWIEPGEMVNETAGLGNSPAHRVHMLLKVKF